jgi:UrcA family protein
MEVGMFRKTAIWVGAAASVFAGAACQVNAANTAPLTAILVTGGSNIASEQVRSVVVHYGDLNLNRPNGVTALYHRINVAAGRACGSEQLTGQTYVSTFWRSCVTAAVTQAVAAVNRPELTSYHARTINSTQHS